MGKGRNARRDMEIIHSAENSFRRERCVVWAAPGRRKQTRMHAAGDARYDARDDALVFNVIGVVVWLL